jgi:hypothetical protein
VHKPFFRRLAKATAAAGEFDVQRLSRLVESAGTRQMVRQAVNSEIALNAA